jgi:virginiamycin B lyase
VVGRHRDSLSSASDTELPIGVVEVFAYRPGSDEEGRRDLAVGHPRRNAAEDLAFARIDPATLAVVDVIPVGSLSFAGPNWMSAGAGSIWTDVPNINAVVRIDPVTDRLVATIPDKGVCGALAASDTAVWVAGGGGPGCLPGITRIEPSTTNTVTAMLNAGGQTDALALGAGRLWYGTAISNFLGRVDPTANQVVGQLKLPGAAFGLSAAYGYVWATDRDDGVLLKFRPA